jgi:hypothetical protein
MREPEVPEECREVRAHVLQCFRGMHSLTIRGSLVSSRNNLFLLFVEAPLEMKSDIPGQWSGYIEDAITAAMHASGIP